MTFVLPSLSVCPAVSLVVCDLAVQKKVEIASNRHATGEVGVLTACRSYTGIFLSCESRIWNFTEEDQWLKARISYVALSRIESKITIVFLH